MPARLEIHCQQFVLDSGVFMVLNRIQQRLGTCCVGLVLVALSVDVSGVWSGVLFAQSPLAKYLGDTDGVVLEVDFRDRKNTATMQMIKKAMTTLAPGAPIFQGGGEIEYYATSISGPEEDPAGQFVLQTSKPIEALSLMRNLGLVGRRNVPRAREVQGETIYVADSRGGKYGLWQPEDRLVVVHRVEALEKLIRGRRLKTKILGSKNWKELNEYQVRIAVGEKLFDKWREEYGRFEGNQEISDPLIDLLLPLNSQITKVFAGLKMDNRLAFRISLHTRSPSTAREVSSSVQALIQIGSATLLSGRKEFLEGIRVEGLRAIASGSLDLVDRLIQSIKYQRVGSEVRITGEVDIRRFVMETLPKTIDLSLAAIQRSQSTNNLRQLGLAMHNYHDTQKRFPPAVIIGPKGHEHSWRVAILPYLGEMELYNQYRFDEPWDSPNNQNVMRQMPEAFRNPADPPGTVNTRYLAFVGKGSPFENPEGFTFGDILDGSSNTIMFFSGATNVPWTKPEDIPFDPEKMIKLQDGPFKEGFNVVMFDGSVRFIPRDIPIEKLYRMIQGKDGIPND